MRIIDHLRSNEAKPSEWFEAALGTLMLGISFGFASGMLTWFVTKDFGAITVTMASLGLVIGMIVYIKFHLLNEYKEWM